MNDDTFGSGDLHAWIEPEIEARMVALILGEASDFEADELERLMEERPELRIFKRRLEAVHSLVGEAVKPGDEDAWRLAPARRAELMEAIGVAPEPEEEEEVVVVSIDDARERRVRKAGLKVALMAAACLMISLLLAPFFMSAGMKSAAPESRRTSDLFLDEDADMAGRQVTLAAPGIEIAGGSSDGLTVEPRSVEVPPARGAIVDRKLESEVRLGDSLSDNAWFYRNPPQATKGPSLPQQGQADGGAREKLAALKKNMAVRDFMLETEAEPPPVSLKAGLAHATNRPQAVPEVPPPPPSSPTPDTTTASGLVAGKLAESQGMIVPSEEPNPTSRLSTPSFALPAKGQPKGAAPAEAPAKPTSSSAAVIASATPEPADAPVPVLGEIPMTGRLFGTVDESGPEDDFGVVDEATRGAWRSGSGSGSGGGGGGRAFGRADGETSEREELSRGQGEMAAKVDSDIERLEEEGKPGSGVSGGGLAGGAERFKSRGRLGAERGSQSRRTRGEAVMEEIVDAPEDSGEAAASAEGLPVVGFETRTTPLGTTGFLAPQDGKPVSQPDGLLPPLPGNGATSDDDVVWTDAVPADSFQASAAKDVEIRTKNVEVRQANTEELAYDWMAQPGTIRGKQQGRVADGLFLGGGTAGTGGTRTAADFISPVASAAIPGIPAGEDQSVSGFVTGGLRSGDAAVTRNSIDAILNNPARATASPDQDEVAPGILSLTGLYNDGQEEMIMRGLAEQKAAEPGYDAGIATDRRAGSYLRYSSDSSNGFGDGVVFEQEPDYDGFSRGANVVRGFDYRDVNGETDLSWMRSTGQEQAGEGEDYNTVEVGGFTIREREAIRREASVEDADGALVDGRENYAKGDYEGAVTKYREALSKLPGGSATETRRKAITEHLADGSVALAQQYRRTGKHDEARDLLEGALIQDPGNVHAKEQLAYLDDPIRTNPAMDSKHSADVDRVRRDLYTGEGFYNLGQYDKANEHFQSVLRTDPYNKAARRWMERISSTKSDYYRAAYDETRARMLAEVDEAWDMAVPPGEEDEKGGKKAAEVDKQRELLRTQLALVDKRLERMGQVVSERRDTAVDKALESHDYIEAKREYESQQALLQSMKLMHSSERIGLKIPKAPITIHEEGRVKKKSGGFLGLGKAKYEGSSTVQINPTAPKVDAFGGKLEKIDLNANMTRQFFATEAEVIEADDTLKKVVEDLGLEKRWGTDQAGAIARLKDSVSAEQVKGTTLLNIKVEEKNAADAKAISKKVAEAYKERRTKMEEERAQRALSALEGALREQEDMVEEKRKVLDTVVQAIGIPYVEGVRGSGEVGRSQEGIYEMAELQASELEKEKQQLQAQLADLSGEGIAANVTASHSGAVYLNNKLDSIVIPEIDFEDTTVEEAMDFLRQRTRELDNTELDPQRKGVNFVVREKGAAGLGADAALDAEGGLGGADAGAAQIRNLKLKNVTLGEALKAIEDQTGLQTKVDEFAVTMVPTDRAEGATMLTRRWSVPASFAKDIQELHEDESGADDPFADGSNNLGGGALRARRPMKEILKELGIRLPEGAAASFLPGSNTLVVKSEPGDLDLVDSLVEQVGEGSPPVDYMGMYEPLDTSGRTAEQDLEDELVTRKLKSIIIPMVDFEEATVEEAIEFIEQRTRELDVAGAESGEAGIDIAVRKPMYEPDLDLDAELGALARDPGAAQVKELKLRNVPVATVLQYVADQAGLRYRINNGRVEMMPIGGGEGQDLITRAWKLHPDVVEQIRNWDIYSGAVDDDPFADADPLAKVESSLERMTEQKPLVDAMQESGVAFPEGSSVVYSPESQVLVVKNTPSNADLVDALVEQTAAYLAKERKAVKANEKSAAQEAFSTFSLHVSDVSFKLAQAALAKGEWPEAERVRVEEFVNALDYGDPNPSQNEKVACQLEQAVHPFMQQRNLLRISMRTAAVGRAAGTPLRLTVLLDNSGSMERADRVESVRNAFRLLAEQLNPQDEVSLISFARTPRLVSDRVSGDKAGELMAAIEHTPSQGGTNLEEALRLGIEKASERMLEGAQNRIILLTDGAANLGNAQPESLAKLVEEMRQKGIAFDACGVGAEGLNDDVLEALTRKGDGRYYFLDRPEDADAGFAKQIAGALRPAAKNVKVQVEFNPKRVGRYRLYGFEKHELKKEDFRNDSVDAAELAAEEAGVAIYQVEPLPDGEGDIGTVSVRFQDMATGEMVEKLWAIPYEVSAPRLERAAPSMKLAASAAFLGEKLKGTPIGEAVELGELGAWSRSLQTVYPSNERVGHLVDMIEQAREMTR